MPEYKHIQHGDQEALKGKTIAYEPSALKQLNAVVEHDQRLRTLPFGAIRKIRELRLNHKKTKSSKHKRKIIRQTGINTKNIVQIQ